MSKPIPAGPSAGEFTPKEAARRADEVLDHMILTPPQPHATHRPGQPRNRKTSASGQAARRTVRKKS